MYMSFPRTPTRQLVPMGNIMRLPSQVFGMVKSHPEGAHRRCSYCLNALMQVPDLHSLP